MARNLLPPTLAKPSSGYRVELGQGKGLMDWIRLTNSGQDLAGTNGKILRVTRADLEAHSKENNAWMVISGKVYNVAPYLEYHPGGVAEAMRAAGKDGTQLFNEIHPWVNCESMLKACLVGEYVENVGAACSGSGLHTDTASSSATKSLADLGIQYNFHGDDNSVSLSIDTRWEGINAEDPVAEIKAKNRLRVLLRPVQEKSVSLVWNLPTHAKSIQACGTKDDTTSGRLVLKFKSAKKLNSASWNKLKPTMEHPAARTFHECKIKSVSPVTKDTKLLEVELPPDCLLSVPVGHHVFIRNSFPAGTIIRPYTPVASSLSSKSEPMKEYLHLMVKFYPDGKMSTFLRSLKPGDRIEISDPEGCFQISQLYSKEALVMLAAGTGFTPMTKLIEKSGNVSTLRRVILVFFNKTESDILWKNELKRITRKNVEVHHVLSNSDSSWKGLKATISLQLLQDLQLSKLHNPLFCICGPTAFTELALELMMNLGLSNDEVHAFKG